MKFNLSHNTYKVFLINICCPKWELLIFRFYKFFKKHVMPIFTSVTKSYILISRLLKIQKNIIKYVFLFQSKLSFYHYVANNNGKLPSEGTHHNEGEPNSYNCVSMSSIHPTLVDGNGVLNNNMSTAKGVVSIYLSIYLSIATLYHPPVHRSI